MRAAAFLLAGALFGLGLVLAGMTDPAKVLNFLDVAGQWDPSLAFVMLGAIPTFALGQRLARRRPAPLLGGSFPGRPLARVDARLLFGAALFGLGWGLYGLCPGPAVTSLGWPRMETLVFVPAMLAGMRAAQVLFGADR